MGGHPHHHCSCRRSHCARRHTPPLLLMPCPLLVPLALFVTRHPYPHCHCLAALALFITCSHCQMIVATLLAIALAAKAIALFVALHPHCRHHHPCHHCPCPLCHPLALSLLPSPTLLPLPLPSPLLPLHSRHLVRSQ
jgi:hypothetical protein